MGETIISCHGINLKPLDSEESDESHKIEVSKVEDEYYVTISHEMTKIYYYCNKDGLYFYNVK